VQEEKCSGAGRNTPKGIIRLVGLVLAQ